MKIWYTKYYSSSCCQGPNLDIYASYIYARYINLFKINFDEIKEN